MAKPQVIIGLRSMDESGGEPRTISVPPIVLPEMAQTPQTPVNSGPKTYLRLQAIAANYSVTLKPGRTRYGPDGLPVDEPGVSLQFRNSFLTLEEPETIALVEKSPHFGPGRDFWDADVLAAKLRKKQEDELLQQILANPELLERANALRVKPDAEDFPPPEQP